MRKTYLIVLLFLIFSSYAFAERIRCASTTSTQNSGLFEYLLPVFERGSGIKVDVIAVGTGAAFEIGKRGDADVLLVHSKSDELRLVNEGYFVERHDVMYNDFIVVGPPGDPAGIAGFRSAVKAFSIIDRKGGLFVSRSDNSGTHKKETTIWKASDVIVKGKKWYLEVGQGMGKTLRIANEKRAYTLTDRGAWLALKDREGLDMMIVVEGDRMLFNQYGIMIVNPAMHSHVKYDAAMKFVEFLVSQKGRNAIASFKDSKGNQLFYPNARSQ